MAAICVQDVDAQSSLRFALIHTVGCTLHRRTSRVIHRTQLLGYSSSCRATSTDRPTDRPTNGDTTALCAATAAPATAATSPRVTQRRRMMGRRCTYVPATLAAPQAPHIRRLMPCTHAHAHTHTWLACTLLCRPGMDRSQHAATRTHAHTHTHTLRQRRDGHTRTSLRQTRHPIAG